MHSSFDYSIERMPSKKIRKERSEELPKRSGKRDMVVERTIARKVKTSVRYAQP